MSTIAIDYTPAYEQGAGIGRYVRELVSALARHDAHTPYRLFVSGASSHLPEPPGKNFQWKSTRLTPKWLARIWHRARIPLPVESFTGRVDLYHATDFVLPPTRARSILTVHDLSFIRVPEAASPSLRAYLNTVVPRSIKRAGHILADSQATKEDIVHFYGTSPNKISVLLSGVDSRFKRSTSTESLLTTRSKYKISHRPYILSVGTVQPRKNYGRLIESLAQVRAGGFDVSLVIVGGRGWLEDPIYATITATGMQEFVHFTGFADEADLPVLYSGAACVAFPSLYEGFGFPVLEGMACGVPVVTSNISSLPEVAGDAALTVDPYDTEAITHAIISVLSDSELRETLIHRGTERVKRFTWDASAQHLQQIYQKMR